MSPDITDAAWRKSTYSGVNGDCFEAATNLPGIVPLRDSKDEGDGPVLLFPRSAWGAFTAGIRGGDFSR